MTDPAAPGDESEVRSTSGQPGKDQSEAEPRAGDARPRPSAEGPTGDARPRPQYGEYATPEEQRARIQQPDATWALETGHSVAAPTYGESVSGGAAPNRGGAGSPVAGPARTGPAGSGPAGSGSAGLGTGASATGAAGTGGRASAPASGPRYGATSVGVDPTSRAPMFDRIITLALLGYGLVNVIFTAVSLFDFASVAETYMRLVGIPGEFTNLAQGELWGPIAAVTLLMGWAITAAVALRRVRQGRRAWWIPLVGAVITYVVSSIFLSIPLINDPAIAAYIASLS